MDLPVPVVGLVDALVERRRVEHQVVGRAVERRGQQAQDLLERLRGAGQLRVRGTPEVRLVVARHDPQLERRARRVRREADAGGVLEDQPLAGSRPRRGRAGRRGRRPRGSGSAPRRRAPRRRDAGSAAGRRSRGTGGRSSAPACAPQFWTTWRYCVPSDRPASSIASRARISICTTMPSDSVASGPWWPRGATMVCHEPTSPSRPSPGSRPSWAPASRASRSPAGHREGLGLEHANPDLVARRRQLRSWGIGRSAPRRVGRARRSGSARTRGRPPRRPTSR